MVLLTLTLLRDEGSSACVGKWTPGESCSYVEKRVVRRYKSVNPGKDLHSFSRTPPRRRVRQQATKNQRRACGAAGDLVGRWYGDHPGGVSRIISGIT